MSALRNVEGQGFVGTMVCGEVSISGANVLEFACSRVRDLYIAGDVAVTVYFAELVECFICNIGDVQLVVA